MFLIKVRLKKALLNEKQNFLIKDPLWEVIGFENIFSQMETSDLQLAVINYFIKNQKNISEKLKNKFKKVLDNYLIKTFAYHSNETNKLYNYIIGTEELSFTELSNIFTSKFQFPYLFYNNLMKNMVATTFDEFDEIKRITNLFMINNYINKISFSPFEIYFESYKIKDRVTFYKNYFKTIGASNTYFFNNVIKIVLTDFEKNKIVDYINENTLEFEIYFNKLLYDEKIKINIIYAEVTGEDYNNYLIKQFKK